MEEEKAAAYYDELTRKGEGAARFKQGLGFSSSSSPSDPFPPKSSSLFTSFVRASGPEKAGELQKQSQLENIQNKLRTSHHSPSADRSIKDEGGHSGRSRRPSSSSGSTREKREESHRELSSRRGHRSRDTEEEEGGGGRERYDKGRRRRSPSEDREGHYSSNRESSYRGRRRRSRSSSPSRVSHHGDRDRTHRKVKDSPQRKSSNDRSAGGVDPSKLIEGYSQMTPAERVKAKMKLQLSQTAAKDTTMGMSTGWERFDFNKDAPLDDDEEEMEVAEDDMSVVKNIGRSFRFSAVEARREEEVKAAHDRAMFGGASAVASSDIQTQVVLMDNEDTQEDSSKHNISSSVLISDKVLSMQQGSWRDRARRLQNESE